MAVYSPVSQCRGKRQYLKRDAKRAGKRTGHGVESYECPHCGWWHNGKPPERRR